MKFDILTLFPAMFDGPFTESIIKRAVEDELIDIRLHNIRDCAFDRHKTADDYPYGGGAGMVMKPEPLTACIEKVKAERPAARVILTTPQGKPFNQELAGEGRILVRPSGTEPVVRVLAEARDFQKATLLCARISDLVRPELG